jgi:hypothetical protein
MPFVGLFWLKMKPNRTGLFFVASISGLGVVNHAAALLAYFYETMFFLGSLDPRRSVSFLNVPFLKFQFQFSFLRPPPGTIVALVLAVGFSYLSYKIFQIVRLLYVSENALSVSGILREKFKKCLYGTGIIACLLAAGELYFLSNLLSLFKISSFSFIFRRACVAGLLVVALVCVVLFTLAWYGKLSRFWKWVGVLLLIVGLALLMKSPAFPSEINAAKGFTVALVCLTFAGVRKS